MDEYGNTLCVIIRNEQIRRTTDQKRQFKLGRGQSPADSADAGGGEAQLVQSSLVNDFALAKTALRAPRPEISIERRFEGSFIAIARRISISALLRRREDESSD